MIRPEVFAMQATDSSGVTSAADPVGRLPFDDSTRLLARALDEQPAALDRLAQRLEAGDLDPAEIDRTHKIGPALALVGGRYDLATIRNAWRRSLHATAAWRSALDAECDRVGEILGEAGIPWAPIKGVDLGARIYPRREARSTSDLDILIFPADLDQARSALAAGGWRGLHSGSRYERFLRDEGYCWQAYGPGKTLLEVHFRLWGMVPSELGERILSDAESAADLGASARRLGLGDAYLLAAVHAWMDPPPRPLRVWWDLHQIAVTEPAALRDAERRANDLGLQLPLILAAGAAASLWPIAPQLDLENRLRHSLHPREQKLYTQARDRGADAVNLANVSLSRWLAGRPSRHRWRAIVRRIWAHPAIVERETEAALWPLRRIRHLWNRVSRR